LANIASAGRKASPGTASMSEAAGPKEDQEDLASSNGTAPASMPRGRQPIGPRQPPGASTSVAAEAAGLQQETQGYPSRAKASPMADAIASAPVVLVGSKAAASVRADAPTTRKSKKKRWWSTLVEDCPISLAPLAELPSPPFGLEADGSANKHYFDARFLASYLLSSCDFIDPVNRRPLTHAECAALDEHLLWYHPDECGDASVADAFKLFELNLGSAGGDNQAMHAVQREATAVLQHLFRFRSSRRTDQRGRAVTYADAGLTVVDDDDILTSGPPVAGAAAASSGPLRPPGPPERTISAEYPSIDGCHGGGNGPSMGAPWRGSGHRGKGVLESSKFPSLPGGGSSKAKGASQSVVAKSKPKAKLATQAPKSSGSGARGGGRGRGSAWSKPV